MSRHRSSLQGILAGPYKSDAEESGIMDVCSFAERYGDIAALPTFSMREVYICAAPAATWTPASNVRQPGNSRSLHVLFDLIRSDHDVSDRDTRSLRPKNRILCPRLVNTFLLRCSQHVLRLIGRQTPRSPLDPGARWNVFVRTASTTFTCSGTRRSQAGAVSHGF